MYAETSRKRLWIWPLLVVLAWLLVGGPLGPFAGKLAEVQENDNAAYLPQSAESTEALNALLDFQEQETFPTTVVFYRAGGLTADDQAAVAAYADQLAGVDNVAAVGDPIPSADGTAAQVVVQAAGTDGEEVTKVVDDIREILADLARGPDRPGRRAGWHPRRLHRGVRRHRRGAALRRPRRGDGDPAGRLPQPDPAVRGAGAGRAVPGVASAVLYALAKAGVVTISGQSQGILFILAIGAATDYSLLIVARFREELRDHESKYAAMRTAYRAAFEPIVASGLTVILGLLCLLLSDLASLRGLGPVGAFGIAGAMLSSLTLLPAALVLLGRVAYWPFRPQYGSAHTDTKGIWGRVARLISRHTRLVWLGTLAALLVGAGFLTTLKEDPIPQTELFLTETESVQAQDILDAHFESDNANPVQLVVPEAAIADTVALLAQHAGIASQGGQPLVFPLPSESMQRPRSSTAGRSCSPHSARPTG
ncbi:MAG: MMPL family transporter [Nocardioides sp.]